MLGSFKVGRPIREVRFFFYFNADLTKWVIMHFFLINFTYFLCVPMYYACALCKMCFVRSGGVDSDTWPTDRLLGARTDQPATLHLPGFGRGRPHVGHGF